jgi:hypothetical protein
MTLEHLTLEHLTYENFKKWLETTEQSSFRVANATLCPIGIYLNETNKEYEFRVLNHHVYIYDIFVAHIHPKMVKLPDWVVDFITKVDRNAYWDYYISGRTPNLGTIDKSECLTILEEVNKYSNKD